MKTHYESFFCFVLRSITMKYVSFFMLKTSKTNLTPIPKSSSIKLFMTCFYFSRNQTLRHDERSLPKINTFSHMWESESKQFHIIEQISKVSFILCLKIRNINFIKKKRLEIKLTIQLQIIKTSYKRVDMPPIRMCNMTLESSFQKDVNLHL